MNAPPEAREWWTRSGEWTARMIEPRSGPPERAGNRRGFEPLAG